MQLTHDLELFPNYTVTQLLFKDVKNATELRKMAVNGEIKGALINPSMVVDAFQILVAANKAVHLHEIGKMKTRSLYSEIIFNLSPTNNISEAFKRFGVSDSDSAVHIVLVHNKEENLNVDDIISKVDGQQIPVDQVSDLMDAAKIKKDTGCVWSVQSSEAELWDVWTDIDCNDGLLLMDSITPAADCPGSSGGRPYWYPPPLGAPLTQHPLLSRRSSWDQTSNL